MKDGFVMSTQEQIFNRALSEGGAVITNGNRTEVIYRGFKCVYRSDRRQRYYVLNVNEGEDYTEITQEWLLRLILRAKNLEGLSHRIRNANRAVLLETYNQLMTEVVCEYSSTTG